MQCKFCEQQATKILPQSTDEGVTIDMIVACAEHASGWWAGAEWDGRHLEMELTAEPNVIFFHDHGIVRQTRHFVSGKVVLLADASSEALYPELCREVEAAVASGDYSGASIDPRFPSWSLQYLAPAQ